VNPIIVALDMADLDDATRLAKELRDEVGGFKVGLELLTSAGPVAITTLADIGAPVFADVKLHDIPNTVGRAAARIASAGARWITVHGAGGIEMIEAANQGMGGSGVLVVTVLTSLSDDDLVSVGVSDSVSAQVNRLSSLAGRAGAEGVVCSPHEVLSVREVSKTLVIFTPGVRPVDVGAHDQKRVATPEMALKAGADWLVIGRPITSARDPVSAAREIAASLTLNA
jgi:orotidine-5'-phosphate decarboxylase